MAKKSKHTVSINRAPVLTLWATVVAQRLGFHRDEALSLAKAVAGLNAQAKGRRLGIFKPAAEEAKKAREKKRGEAFYVELCGRPVPAVKTKEGVRAVRLDEPIEPDSVQTYLEKKFGDDFGAVRQAMQKLAKSRKPKELVDEAFTIYQHFRPAIPGGKKGWGAKGVLDLRLIESLGKTR